MASSTTPKLTYFKGRGRAEMIRLTCAVAGIEFDETNLASRPPFLQLIKDGKLLFKQLPLFEIDGLQLVGSDTIVRYLGRKANLYGKNDVEKAKIDMLMMGALDFFDAGAGIYCFMPSPEESIEKIVLPVSNNKYLPAFEKSLTENGTGFLVGSSLSIADILVFDIMTHITDSEYPKLVSAMGNYPKCLEFIDMMGKQPCLSEYLSSPRRHPVPTKEYVKTVCETLNMHP